ncbi:hypothetical protein [Streptomyces sp. NPDC086182]
MQPVKVAGLPGWAADAAARLAEATLAARLVDPHGAAAALRGPTEFAPG